MTDGVELSGGGSVDGVSRVREDEDGPADEEDGEGGGGNRIKEPRRER